MESPTTAAYPAPRSEFHPAFTGLVQRVHRAYRAGRLLSIDTSIVASLREFLAGMEQLAADRLSRRERYLYPDAKGTVMRRVAPLTATRSRPRVVS
jgi:hypothetical protein